MKAGIRLSAAGLAFLLLSGCGADPIATAPTNNPGVKAELIAVVESCRIFRIQDGTGRTIYFAKCDGGSSRTQWGESCGKNCSREVEAITEQGTNMAYQRPPGLSLLFASRDEILAAPAAEREAYLRIVDSITTNPEAYGFRYETAADFAAEDAVDRGLAALNGDWT